MLARWAQFGNNWPSSNALENRMDVVFWTGWVTLVGAVIAAFTGVLSVVWQVVGKRDRFRVSMGSIAPAANEATMLHIVSKSDHPIKIADFGFIEKNGSLSSIPMDNDLGGYIAHEGISRGSSALTQRGDAMECGYIRTRPVIGCYARSNLQSRPSLAFSYDTPLLKRWRVRLKVFLAGQAYLR